jgi:hypothetical protein
MIEPLSQQIAVVSAITPTQGLAAATAVNGSTLDTQLYNGERVLILIHLGAIVTGAVTSAKVEVSDASDMSGPADIVGSSQTIAADKDDTYFMIDIINPIKRYLRLVVSRGTQNATVSATYIIYGIRHRPVTSTAVSGVEVHRDKATGTA